MVLSADLIKKYSKNVPTTSKIHAGGAVGDGTLYVKGREDLANPGIFYCYEVVDMDIERTKAGYIRLDVEVSSFTGQTKKVTVHPNSHLILVP